MRYRHISGDDRAWWSNSGMMLTFATDSWMRGLVRNYARYYAWTFFHYLTSLVAKTSSQRLL